VVGRGRGGRGQGVWSRNSLGGGKGEEGGGGE